MRVAILASHPIQYQVPLFRALAKRQDLSLDVFFCSRSGLDTYEDVGFGRSIVWDVPLLGGYRHTFLKSFPKDCGSTSFAGQINPEIVEALRRGGYDTVIMHGWNLATNLICWIGSLMLRVPLLVRGDTSVLLQPTGGRRILKRARLAPLFRTAAGFLAIGTNNARFYRSYGVPAEKIFLAPFSVDNARFMSAADSLRDARGAIRTELGVSDDGPVILYCGKFGQVKNPMELLKAYAKVPRERGAWLLFAGDGELRDKMKHFVASNSLERVRFLGFQNQSLLPNSYVAADLLVIPSQYEAWGLVANEAMCSGLPVLASTRVGCVADLIRDGHNGFSYPAGDIDNFASTLSRMLADREGLIRMGINSRAIIAEWGVEQTADGIVTALSVIGNRAKRI